MRLKVLVLQHVEGEGLGILETLIKKRGIETRFIKIFRGERVYPTIDGFSGVISLGGPMAVYEDNLYPFIRDELSLIKNALKDEKPFLGICLGAQLLAKAAGADVYPGKKKEIGWYSLTLTEEGKRDRLFMGIPEEFTVFQWHGDTFDIPPNGECLASSKLFVNQALRIGENAYGLQFHLEVTENMIKDWFDLNEKEIGSLKKEIDPKRILKEISTYIESLHKVAEVVLSRFIYSIEGIEGS